MNTFDRGQSSWKWRLIMTMKMIINIITSDREQSSWEWPHIPRERGKPRACKPAATPYDDYVLVYCKSQVLLLLLLLLLLLAVMEMERKRLWFIFQIFGPILYSANWTIPQELSQCLTREFSSWKRSHFEFTNPSPNAFHKNVQK